MISLATGAPGEAAHAARPGRAATRPAALRVVRRARPLLGTLVEIGTRVETGTRASADADRAIAAAFDRIAAIQARLSRFDPGSEIARFNAAPAGACVAIGADTQRVLSAARALSDASGGLFDVTLGSGLDAWQCARGTLRKLSATVRIDLGGIGKGHTVDRAVDVLAAAGMASGWVNAGGDLRVFGALMVPIDLRDEDGGGVRHFATLGDGAFATSRFAAPDGQRRHASVAAPRCLWADALTKLVVASGDAAHALLGRFGARAWLHAAAPEAGAG